MITLPTRRCSLPTIRLGVASDSSWRWACRTCSDSGIAPTPAAAIRSMTAHVDRMTRQADPR